MAIASEASLMVYRGHHIRAVPKGAGWVLRIRTPRRQGATILRNHVPDGLSELLAEARARIDRLVDGAPWQQAP